LSRHNTTNLLGYFDKTTKFIIINLKVKEKIVFISKYVKHFSQTVSRESQDKSMMNEVKGGLGCVHWAKEKPSTWEGKNVLIETS